MSVNYVHQDAIHAENVKKELHLQRLRSKSYNKPSRKLNFSADSPLLKAPPEYLTECPDVREATSRSYMEPKQRRAMPRTESEEIGWVSMKLIQDKMFSFRRVSTDVTKHADHAWKHRIKPF